MYLTHQRLLIFLTLRQCYQSEELTRKSSRRLINHCVLPYVPYSSVLLILYMTNVKKETEMRLSDPPIALYTLLISIRLYSLHSVFAANSDG